MSRPLWVREGAQCECIDPNWVDTFDMGTTGRYPQVGERFTIAAVHELLGKYYIQVEETFVSDDLYAISGFRPLTPLEHDAALFASLLKDAAASPRREPVPA